MESPDPIARGSREYAQAIPNKGAALTNCFGFVDGTIRQISRPGKNQRMVYNGHKRCTRFEDSICGNT